MLQTGADSRSLATSPGEAGKSERASAKGFVWEGEDGESTHDLSPHLQSTPKDVSSLSQTLPFLSPNTTPQSCAWEVSNTTSKQSMSPPSQASSSEACGGSGGGRSSEELGLGSGGSWSSLSSASLQGMVSREGQEAALIAQVKSLQQEAVVLREGIAGGKVGVAHVQSALETMTRGHAHLAAAVAMVATSLEVVNQQSRGRAAKHIAASHTSLGSELHSLAQHLRGLEDTLHSNCCDLTEDRAPSLPPHPPPSPSPPHSRHETPGHVNHNDAPSFSQRPPLEDGHSSAVDGTVDESLCKPPAVGSSVLIERTHSSDTVISEAAYDGMGGVAAGAYDGSLGHTPEVDSCVSVEGGSRELLRLPDVYLTPSAPTNSRPSSRSSLASSLSHQHSPLAPSISASHDSPFSSLPSSSSQLDPFTPDVTTSTLTHSAVADRESKSTGGEVMKREARQHVMQGSDSLLRPTPVLAAGSRPACEGYNTHNNASVLEWLQGTRERRRHCSSEIAKRKTGTRETDSLSDFSEASSPQAATGGGGFCVASDQEDWDGREFVSPSRELTEEAALGGPPDIAALDSPVSPPVSSPCADSGISGSNYSHPHSSLPPTSHRRYRDHKFSSLSVTADDIEAMRSELAELREQIMDPSRWSHTLSRHCTAAPDTSQGHTPLQSRSKLLTAPPLDDAPSVSRPFQTAADTGSRHTLSVSSSFHTTRVSKPFDIPAISAPTYTSTPAVSRPYQFVSRQLHTASSLSRDHAGPHSSPTPHTNTHSSRRYLFSSNTGDSVRRNTGDSVRRNTGDSIRRNTGDSIRRNTGDFIRRNHQSSGRTGYVSVVSPQRMVAHATQTTPHFNPRSPSGHGPVLDTHSSTDTQCDRRGSSYSSVRYSKPSFPHPQHSTPTHGHHDSFTLPPSSLYSLTPSLPASLPLPAGYNLTPRLIVHTVHGPSGSVAALTETFEGSILSDSEHFNSLSTLPAHIHAVRHTLPRQLTTSGWSQPHPL